MKKPGLKRTATLFGALGVLVLLSSCSLTVRITGSGPVTSQSYSNLTSFDKIGLSGTGNLKITQGSQESVVVRADENLLQYLSIASSNGTLEIGLVPFTTIVSFNTLEYDVTLPSLAAVTLTGAGEVSSTGAIPTGGAAMRLSGVGSVSLDLTSTGAVTVYISGTGSATLSGSAPSLTSNLSGVGSLSARGMSVKNAVVSISGIGGAEVTATDSLTYSLSGIGSLTYWGNPPTVQGYNSGIGTVNPGV